MYEDVPQADGPRMAGGANRIGRDSRLDSMTAQANELVQASELIANRVTTLISRLDGPRPSLAGTATMGSEKVPHQPGYLGQLQDSLSQIRIYLEQTHESLNQLDEMI